MNPDPLEQAVDRFVEDLTLGAEPDPRAAAGELDETQRAEFEACAAAARWLEQTVINASKERLTESGLPTLGPGGAFDEVPIAKELGDFELIGEVGRGGMGIVFEARQKSLQRRVALKVLPPGVRWSETATTRFAREAKAAGKLRHANIVPVYSYGESAGVSYFAMQFIDGITLAEPSKRYRREDVPTVSDAAAATPTLAWPAMLPRPETPSYYRAVATALAEVADAVHYAHQSGVVHRDVKPSNVMLDESGHAWIMDFGLARMVNDAAVTRSGQLLGTLCYMSPEQAAGKGETNERSDIYGLGATLYELIALKPPYGALRPQVLLKAIRSQEPDRPSMVNPHAPVELEAIALKAMSKSPERRYASARELADDLGRFLAATTTNAERSVRFRSPQRRFSGWLVPAAAAVAVVLLGAAVVSFTMRQRPGPSNPIGTTQSPAPDPFTEQMNAGLRAFRAGEVDVAASHFAEASRVSRDSAEPHAFIGLAALRSQTATGFADASNQFLQAAMLAPSSNVLRALERATRSSGDASQDLRWDLLYEVCEQILQRPCEASYSADGILALGRIIASRNPSLATEMMTAALTCPPELTEALAERGRLHYRADRFAEARADLSQATSLAPENAAYWVLLGWTAHALGDQGAAKAAFERAVALSETIPVLKERFAWMKTQEPELEEVFTPFGRQRPITPELLSEYRRIVAMPPRTFEDFFALGQVHAARGLSAQAQDAFLQAVGLLPAGRLGHDAGLVHLEIAKLYGSAGRDDDARAAFRRAIGASPSLDFYLEYCNFYADRQRWENLIGLLDNATGDGVVLDVRGYVAKAKAYIALGRPEPARRQLEQARRQLAGRHETNMEVESLLSTLGEPAREM